MLTVPHRRTLQPDTCLCICTPVQYTCSIQHGLRPIENYKSPNTEAEKMCIFRHKLFPTGEMDVCGTVTGRYFLHFRKSTYSSAETLAKILTQIRHLPKFSGTDNSPFFYGTPCISATAIQGVPKKTMWFTWFFLGHRAPPKREYCKREGAFFCKSLLSFFYRGSALLIYHLYQACQGLLLHFRWFHRFRHYLNLSYNSYVFLLSRSLIW